ncbi:MAG TPA: histidine kinase dimerization/phosphoacceptor domain -containing protein [Bacteroidia bacterium]|nr:histidine kinase dimerization/phosphoacceptor domain -containing protein [Bacteroidia bacterium]
MEFYEKREARMVNLFAWIAFIGSVAGITTVFFINAKYPTFIATFSVFTALAVLVLNYKGFYNAATYTFVGTTCISIFVIVQQYEANVGNYLYYFPLIFCVALVHNPLKSNLRTFVLYAMIAISFLCAWLLDIDSLKNTTVSQRDNEILLVYNSILTFFITVIMVYLVVKLINRQNNESLGLLKKEQEAQKIIAQSLKEKETLLAEIQHRVKNNLAIITGLLNLQTEKAPCDESKQLMVESRNRVMSISMVHERLYSKENLSRINLKQYVSELVQELIKSFPVHVAQIKVVEDLEKIELELTKAVPIGLIINEALTNSLKHAFNHKPSNPTISIKMQLIYDRIHLCLKDNGNGFNDITKRKETSLGLSLIESLCDQIDAEVVFKNEEGACVSIIFPV